MADLQLPDALVIIGGTISERVEVSSAQILAAHDTPITLIAALGAGKVIVPVQVIGLYTFGTEVYTGQTILNIGWGGIPAGQFASADLSLSADHFKSEPGQADCNLSQAANQPVIVFAEDANPEDGDGSIAFDLLYRILDVA